MVRMEGEEMDKRGGGYATRMTVIRIEAFALMCKEVIAAVVPKVIALLFLIQLYATLPCQYAHAQPTGKLPFLG